MYPFRQVTSSSELLLMPWRVWVRVLLHSARVLLGTCFMVGMLVPSASSHEGRSTPTPTPTP